jgi:hypothetical protein
MPYHRLPYRQLHTPQSLPVSQRLQVSNAPEASAFTALFPESIIFALRQHCTVRPTISLPVRELELPDASVDIAVDKGTLDAFIHGSLWDPPDDVRTNVGKYINEIARVLRPGGLWLYITYRQPHFMKPLPTREKQWDLSVEVLEDSDGAGGFDCFGYVMERHYEKEDKPDSGLEV